jgi:hypothetical protein
VRLGDEKVVKSLCINGVEKGGDGSDPQRPAQDCVTLVTRIEVPIYENDDKPVPYWLPLPPNKNMALSANGGIAHMSSFYGTEPSSQEAINGDPSANGGTAQ